MTSTTHTVVARAHQSHLEYDPEMQHAPHGAGGGFIGLLGVAIVLAFAWQLFKGDR